MDKSFRHIFWTCGTIAADFREQNRIGNRRERFADAAQIFIGKNREDAASPFGRQKLRAMFVPEHARRLDYARRR